MMPVWPASLPIHADRDGFSYVHGDARRPSQTDAGNVRQRRRLSFVPDPVRFTMLMTLAQRRDAQAFFKDTLKDHTLPFRFPAQPQPGTWIVQIGQSMPAWTSVGIKWRLSLELAVLG